MRTDLAFNMINRQNQMINYYFYLNAAYKDLTKRNYLGKDFLTLVKDNINKTATSNRDKFYTDDYNYNCCLTNASVHHNIIKFHHKDVVANKEAFFNKLFSNRKRVMLLLESFYDKLLSNYYNKNGKYHVFSVFKPKDEKDNSYSILLGNIKLEKCLSAKDFSFLRNFDKNKYMPIGDYFVMVKFSRNNSYKRDYENPANNVKVGDLSKLKPFPTNILKVQYFLTEKDIDDKYIETKLDFEYF